MENRHDLIMYADLLYEAERLQTTMPPLTEMEPDMTVDDAYAIQINNIRRVTSMGYVISGKKIGLTSPGIQKQLGVNEPDYGHLFAAMECPSGIVQTNQLILPKIEAELAFVLQADLTGGQVTAEDVVNATAYVVGAFEIVDSRIENWKIKLVDTVADNASSGRYILGTKKRDPREANLKGETMRLYKNNEFVGEGSGEAVLGDPSAAVAWLANCLWKYGVPLQKGEVILSGAFSAAPAAERDDEFRVEFSTFGTLYARFV